MRSGIIKSLIVLIFAACNSGGVVRFDEQQAVVISNMKDGIQVAKSLDKLLFVVIINDNDSSLYELSTNELLNLSQKKDRDYVKILKRDFVVVKLYCSELKNFLTERNAFMHYEDQIWIPEPFKFKSFVFISSPIVFSLYGPAFLDDKEAILDRIWVGMGP